MDSRWYFVFGDLFANLLVGAVAGWLCALAIGVGWPMLAAMVVAMALGMVVGLVLFFPMGILLGAMEVMLPAMCSGMFSGMLVGMWDAMKPLDSAAALGLGAGCGAVCIVSLWLLNSLLRGVRDYG